MSTSKHQLNFSLFDRLKADLDQRVPIIRCTKATLVHLSHTLEDIVLKEKLPAILLTGFQESSHWKQETERYREIAEVAHQVCIFAGKPLPAENEASQIHVELHEDDLLRQEWFLLILSSRFSVLLCGQDTLTDTSSEATREFDTIWTFDPQIIKPVLDILEQVVGDYRPERLATLQAARQAMDINYPEEDLLLQFTIELIRFEETLNSSLRQQQRLIDTVLDTLNYHLYVTEIHDDGRTIAVYRSSNIERITGYSLENLSEPNFWLSRVHPEDQDIAALIEGRLDEDVTIDVVDYRFRHADGSYIWVQNNARLFRDHTNKKWLVYGVFQDITVQKEIEELRRKQQELQFALESERQMSALKSYFMYTVSHEFRTPLSSILSSAELLKRYHERMDKENLENKVDNIREQVLHLNQMLEDISDVVNNRIDRLGFTPTSVNLNQFVEFAINDLRMSEEITHRVDYRYLSNQTHFMIDPKLLRQIVTNLISNAVKYSPGKDYIECEIHISDIWITLKVIDYGIGIPEEDREYLFEPFHRSQNVGAIGGVGLGLKIAHDCVIAHNGTIAFHSEVNKGTTFIVKLPAIAAEK